jgi:hypothetical protein
VPEDHIGLHSWTSQIQIPVLQTVLLTHIALILNKKRRGFRLSQATDAGGLDFDGARLQPGVNRFRTPGNHLTMDLDDILMTQAMGRGMNLFRVRMSDHLYETGSITHIQENNATMIALGLYPATETNGLADLPGCKCATIRALHG